MSFRFSRVFRSGIINVERNSPLSNIKATTSPSSSSFPLVELTLKHGSDRRGHTRGIALTRTAPHSAAQVILETFLTRPTEPTTFWRTQRKLNVYPTKLRHVPFFLTSKAPTPVPPPRPPPRIRTRYAKCMQIRNRPMRVGAAEAEAAAATATSSDSGSGPFSAGGGTFVHNACSPPPPSSTKRCDLQAKTLLTYVSRARVSSLSFFLSHNSRRSRLDRAVEKLVGMRGTSERFPTKGEARSRLYIQIVVDGS